MRKLESNPIKYEEKPTFKGIPEDEYYKTINKIDEKLKEESRKDSIAKQKSEEFARTFVVNEQTSIIKNAEIEPPMPARRVWDCSAVLVFDSVIQDNADEYIAQLKSGKRKLDLPQQTFDTAQEIKDADEKFMEFFSSPQLNGIIAGFKNKKDALVVFENYLNQKTIDRPPQPLEKDILAAKDTESSFSTRLPPTLDEELDKMHEQYMKHVHDLRFKSNVGATPQQAQCEHSRCVRDDLENEL